MNSATSASEKVCMPPLQMPKRKGTKALAGWSSVIGENTEAEPIARWKAFETASVGKLDHAQEPL
jgi:hypothetical protein